MECFHHNYILHQGRFQAIQQQFLFIDRNFFYSSLPPPFSTLQQPAQALCNACNDTLVLPIRLRNLLHPLKPSCLQKVCAVRIRLDHV